ncbi:alpha/beta fold hydrolase [Geobacter pickeringii]|uniref:Alpha/beta hydrolase n=1 Tax=Geobacter pickeringii TaxID=345632 RepID=A0A0B5B947_9BACT|nr:alpha/beta hydrolase [Geobacter pickeringii]AJE03263.1 alpha/beta hydrolase [Geobacter pickeringii]
MARPSAPPLCARGDELLYAARRILNIAPGITGYARMVSALLPCLTGVGCLYQAIATAIDRRRYPPPGRLLKIQGTDLHVHATDNRGAPAVILETGLGGMSSAWGWIQPEVAKFTRVVSYDRPGLGWSATDDLPRTALNVARRLRALLHDGGMEGPYVLAGHSMGGLYLRVFADQYPEEVAGMVLIDAAHPDQHKRSPAIRRHMSSGFRMLRTVPLLARLGYVRATGFFSSWPVGLPERPAAEAGAFLSSYTHLKTTRDESLAWDAVCDEVRGTRSLGDRPLAVVSAGKDVLPGAHELQTELAALSSRSTHLTVEGADHVTLVTHRQHALAVVDAIHTVVQMASRY